MSTNTLTPVEKINRHLTILGFGGSNLHKTIEQWDNANGSEWTVKRLKTLKDHFIHLIAGIPFEKEWIAYRGGVPKGPFGQLFTLGFKNPKRCLSVLNSYMAYKSPSIDKIKDVFQNISLQQTKDVQDFCKAEFWDIGARLPRLFAMRKLFKELTVENIKPSISASLNTSKPFVKKTEVDDVQWLDSLKYTSRKVLPTDALSHNFYAKETLNVEKYGGELVVLPEKGNKARVIALPHAELQIFLKPLHDTLSKCLQLLEADCTHDQIKGAKFAQDALKSGKTVHSVDLSAATDRFPLFLQVATLRKLNNDPHAINWASIFERSAKLLWSSPVGDIAYGAGQPMGLYGSFNLFALTHHAVLQRVKEATGVKTDCYRILGDDIVITDDKVAAEYKLYMQSIGVTVSPSKTITSNTVAEFAGFVITKKSLMKAAKPVDLGLTVDNMINYIHTMGCNPFKSKLKDLGDLLVYLPTPYGAGLNPRGLSRESRLNFYRSEDITEKLLSVKSNIDTHIFAKRRESQYWNSYLGSYDSSLEGKTDVILDYFSNVANDIRTELSSTSDIPGDSRFKREHLLNNIDSESTLAYAGSLGQAHKVVSPDEYVSEKISWYKKLFGFYPWKN
jgi:hypothetical protein